MEIERKFLLRAIPGGKILSANKGHQGYFSLDPEVRFRRKQNFDPITFKETEDPKYFGTIKSVGSLVRDEVEGQISKDFYYHMVDVIALPFIEKIQYVISYKEYKIEASIVDKGSASSFIYAEVEFPSEEDAIKFVWPWPNIMIKEVTGDPNYYLQNYWKKTRLE